MIIPVLRPNGGDSVNPALERAPFAKCWRDCRLAAHRGAGAAILGQIGEELVHRAVFGGIDQLAAQPPLGDEPGMDELLEVKRQEDGATPAALR
jgi:hypothetical protein